jgi:hypothetical protein
LSETLIVGIVVLLLSIIKISTAFSGRLHEANTANNRSDNDENNDQSDPVEWNLDASFFQLLIVLFTKSVPVAASPAQGVVLASVAVVLAGSAKVLGVLIFVEELGWTGHTLLGINLTAGATGNLARLTSGIVFQSVA